MENWLTVCAAADIAPNVGVCALVEDQQIAIFNCQRSDSLYAVSNYDPIGKANILSRGIIGCIEGQPYVASPLYKQHFHLQSGDCLEQPEHKLTVYPVRAQDGQVQIQLPSASTA